MKNGVYQIRNTIDNKCYIGSCAGVNGLVHRWRQHVGLLSRNQHYAIHLQNAWNKHDLDVFVFEVLLYCDPKDCLMYEQIALDYYQPEYNTCPEAGSCRGRQFSEQTLVKMSENNSGSNNPFYGKQHSIQTRKAISDGKKGFHLGINNPSCKLSESEVMEIKIMLQRNMPRKEIGEKFSISLATISDIANKKRWSHV